MRNFLFAILSLSFYSLFAQNTSNWRMRVIHNPTDTVLLDSLTIIPGSLSISDAHSSEYLPDSSYVLLQALPALYLKKTYDSIRVTYRVFKGNLYNKYFLYDFEKYQNKAADFITGSSNDNPKKLNADDVLRLGDLRYSGDFTRGISFGNASDIAVNSAFNLQVNGDLGNGFSIKAELTDNNVPIQPDGNTQQLREFDKLFIQLSKRAHLLSAGNIDVSAPASYFLKYQKKWQGISYSTVQSITKKTMVGVQSSASIARGIFARNDIIPIDGNKGPYKLFGNSNESFIIVLAGSERVYINGQLKQRGENADYIIDYNFGEITFTAKQLITKNLRIVVEFEYSNNTYLRSAITASAYFKTKHWKPYFAFYNEQDSKNQPLDIQLGPKDIGLLKNIGNDVTSAYTPAYDTAKYQSDKIQYEMIDTIIEGVSYDSVFRISNNSLKALYDVQFSYVGKGKGNYVIGSNTSNGRVYSWIVPIGNVPQGEYEALRLLVAPKKTAMLVAGTEWQADSLNKLDLEIAYSQSDPNTFSKLDNNINAGVAAHLGWSFNEDSHIKHKGKPTFGLSYEFKQKHFSPIERYRGNEFSFDWNLPKAANALNEHLISFTTALHKNGNALKYTGSFLYIPKSYFGFRNTLETGYAYKSVHTYEKIIHTFSKSDSTTMNLMILDIGFKNYFDKRDYWSGGFRIYPQMNFVSGSDKNIPESASYLYENYDLFLTFEDSLRNSCGIAITFQQDHSGSKNLFAKPNFKANNVRLSAHLAQLKNQQLDADLVFRYAAYEDTLRGNQSENPAQLNSKIFYLVHSTNNAIRNSLNYETGSGLEPRFEYIYVLSPSGIGNFAYTDFNRDGVQQANEFYTSPFADENVYQRFINTAGGYSKVNTLMLNEYLEFLPSRLYKNSKKGIVNSIVNRCQFNSQIQVNRKLFADKGILLKSINPFYFHGSDTTIASQQMTEIEQFFFNRTSTIWSTDFSINAYNQKSNFTSGFEKRKSIVSQWNLRISPVSRFIMNYRFTNSAKRNFAQLFPDRRYSVLGNALKSEFTYQINAKYRVNLSYEYSYAESTSALNGDFAVKHEVASTYRVSSPKRGIVDFNFTYSFIGYKKGLSDNPSLEFALLNGLKAGSNYIWSVNFLRKIGKNLQLNLQYNGRASGEKARVIHSANASIRAIF